MPFTFSTESEIQELLSIVNSVAIKAVDKNTRTRALWVISKQSFPSDIVGKLVPSIIGMLETVLNKGDLHSMVVEYEALNVIIRLIEQAPSHMEEQAVKWAKLIIPLVVHSAHKVQLRGATALEMGVPLLLQKQQEVAAVTEELMTTKIIPELQKLFASKNETYVLKLWPLFVKLLGKALHRSGSFINSLLQLEELGFRSGSPVVKKIAFIAWKSLIDNFALNPEILCSAKRLKLLMQPLSSIHVRTEALALTKLEVWWYLLMRLGPHLPAHFEQVISSFILTTLSLDSVLQGNSSRLAINQSLLTPGAFPNGTPANQRMSLSSSTGVTAIPSIQLLGIEMLLHFFMGPEVLTFSKENNIVLSLEPLQHSVITSPSFLCKHASTFINAVQDGFIAVGKDASGKIIPPPPPRILLCAIKRERQSSDVLTMLLQALKNIVVSNELSVLKSMSLIEITIKELPPKVLGSPAYQVADMDLLNGTPALFLIQLSFHEDLLKCYVQDERFFLNYESLVGCVLSGPTSPLTFSESVFTIVNQSSKYLENKEHLWRMWSIIVNPLTEWINQTNEVNQGDALEHNFSALYSALLLPVNTIFPCSEFPQPTMKTLLRSWSELYRAFARCALLVATAEDNLCCEELCAKIISGLEDDADIVSTVIVMVDCINFEPYGTKCQPSNRSPQMSTDWSRKKKDPLGKLSSLIKLLVILVNSLQRIVSKESSPERKTSISTSVIGALQNIIGHISLPSVIRPLFRTIAKPLSAFYEKTKSTNASKVTNGLNNKFEKLLAESISCFQSSYAGSFDSELLQELSPLLCIMLLHKNKQLRSQAAQFWNATFGKAVVLTYPEELKCVLCQAKQKNLLSLPGFESTDVVGECNGTCSDSVSIRVWHWLYDLLRIAHEVTESGKADVLPENNNSTTAEQLTTSGKQSLDTNCEKLETCAPKSVPGETSVLDCSLNECTSNVSSCSSASSDVISGTPQPVSRRQSFITLEKFNSSENRPFSPTTFTVSNLEILDENKANSKLQPESTLGIKKSSLRQNKTDNSEEEKSKISQLQQEKNMQESPANLVEDKCELPGEIQEPEYLLDIPSQVSELNAVGCTIENKQILDNVAETKAGANLDSKENTPPELPLAAATISNVGQSPQVSPHPKALRRSLRRKPETAEGASGSPDKENSQQKKDGRKDGEKVLPKKISQSKEASAQKQKSVPDKTIDAQGSIKKEINVHGSRTAEGTILKDSHVSRTIQEETSIANEKSEGSQSSDISDLQDSVPETTGEKPKGFPRYQTRRTSQGLLISIENSESDSSETREEGTKRKRLGRSKNKSSSLESSSIESQVKEVLESQEFHAKPATEIQTMAPENKDVMHSDEHMEIALLSGVTGQERERTSLPLSECSGLEQDTSLCRDSSDTERTAARMLTRSTSDVSSSPEKSSETKGSPELKLKESKKMANKSTMALPSIPAAADSQFAERLNMEPCAASTPLSSISNSSALKDSHEGIRSEEDLLGGDTPKEELKKSSHVKDESDTSIAENLDCVGLAEATSEPSSVDSDSVEHIVQCPSLEADTDPGAVKTGDSIQNGHPEGRTDVEMSVNQPEEIKGSETKADIVQNVPELQEQDAESDIASRSEEHEISALVQKENSSDSPLKFQEIYALSVAKISESPNGVQARCIWSPSASPSTSILKRGVKRQKEEDSPSPANKSRRVSFANPIYQEELADDIDRRSPVVRTHSSNGSQSFRSIKSSPNHQAKLITTPTKGSLSPGSRSHKYKSSKKCLITEMVKEPLPSPTECIYPALVGCKAPVDTILPQITSNIWARGLGQLIRAKNIRTVGDLSSLTSAEIKTLPIRSPKVSNVKRALKGYHDQQVRSHGFEENAGLDDVEKPVNGIDEKSCSTNEDKIETGKYCLPLCNLFAQIDILAPQFTSENLLNYSVSELFEMQEKLHSMTNCIMKNLQARWKSPTRESTV
uniref:Replication timing regulatory factor 1 n=1 Tax=Podarcis muralis TaxID=64176 RepID=A0A670HUX7_PODMU